MIYKNSMKLLTSNFKFVWKQLAYTLVRVFIVVGLAAVVANPILRALQDGGFYDNLKTVWEVIYTRTGSVFIEISHAFENFSRIIASNISTLLPFVLLFFVDVYFINSYLKNFGEYVLMDVENNAYISLNNTGYCHSMVTKFTKASKYAFVKLLMCLPFDLMKVLFVYVYCCLFSNTIIAIVGIPIIIILNIVTESMQLSAYVGVAPSMINMNANPFKSVFAVYKNQKGFLKIFGNAVIAVTTILFANTFIGVFTLGAGFLITVPASMVLVSTFKLLSYYYLMGQRYYLSPMIIVDPTNNNLSKD